MAVWCDKKLIGDIVPVVQDNIPDRSNIKGDDSESGDVVDHTGGLIPKT